MRMRQMRLAAAVTLAGLSGATLLGAEPAIPTRPAVDLENLPANRWFRLPEAPPALDYRYNNAVYDPLRRQLVLYTPTGVAAFDVAKRNWVQDYDAFSGRRVDVLHLSGGYGKGVSWKGIGALSPSGHPEPSYTAFGACWDSKRNRMLLVMRGLMAAYDPEAKKWTDLGAKTILYDKEYPGGPPVYNVGVCYDPVNDEILMQPHFATWDDWYADFPPILNFDRLAVDGRMSSHLGTFRYRFADNTWRRVSGTLGSEEVRTARGLVLELTAAASRAADAAWALRRRPDAADTAKVRADLEVALRAAGRPAAQLPAEAREAFAQVLPLLKTAAEAAGSGKWDEAMQAGNRAWWELDCILDGPLRVEPPARCAAPMVYDSRRECIVLHGGRAGGRMLNDTWVYECRTRQWRELRCAGPDAIGFGLPKVFYDPGTGLVMSITQKERDYGRTIPATATLWTLDVSQGKWLKRHEQASPPEEFPGLSDPHAATGYDPERRLLVFTHENNKRYETLLMRLDLAALPSSSAPEQEHKQIRPHVLPPDDPEWLAKLKPLPPNTWTIPWKQGPAMRDWGTLGCDPVRGLVFYFGGGHSTYQWNDVAIYQPGANQWVSGPGEYNDFFVPGVRWNGVTMGFRGGKPATHCGHNYDACDGRMYVSNGVINEQAVYGGYGKSPDWRYAWFYDLNRGGVWRWQKATDVQLGEGVDGAYGALMLADPAGRMCGMTIMRGRPGRDLFSTLDIYTGRLRINKVPPPRWPPTGEGQPFCYVAGRSKVFWFTAPGTFLYDPDANRVEKLDTTNEPDNKNMAVNLVVSLDGQDAVYAVVKGEEWVYSFKRNAWARLKTNKATLGIPGPYGQIVYVTRHGILVSTRDGIMRPDLSRVEWKEKRE